MKNNPKSAQEAELSNNQMKDNLKVYERLKKQSNERQLLKCTRCWSNNQMKNNPKSARDAEVLQMKNNPKSAREAKVTIEWKTIVKVHEMLK